MEKVNFEEQLIFQKKYDVSMNNEFINFIDWSMKPDIPKSITLSYLLNTSKSPREVLRIWFEDSIHYDLWQSNIVYSKADNFYHLFYATFAFALRHEINDFLHIIINEYGYGQLERKRKFETFEKVDMFIFHTSIRKKGQCMERMVTGKISQVPLFFMYRAKEMSESCGKFIYAMKAEGNERFVPPAYSRYLSGVLYFYNAVLSDARFKAIKNALENPDNEIYNRDNMLLKIKKYTRNKAKITDILTGYSVDVNRDNISMNERFEFTAKERDDIELTKYIKPVIHNYIQEHY